MKKVRITAIRKACYKDLIQQYENPLDNACTIEDGQVFIAGILLSYTEFFCIALIPYFILLGSPRRARR